MDYTVDPNEDSLNNNFVANPNRRQWGQRGSAATAQQQSKEPAKKNAFEILVSEKDLEKIRKRKEQEEQRQLKQNKDISDFEYDAFKKMIEKVVEGLPSTANNQQNKITPNESEEEKSSQNETASTAFYQDDNDESRLEDEMLQ